MGDVKLNAETFSSRLKKLYEAWQAGGEAWGGANSIAIVAGSAQADLSYLKSSSLQLWLFAYELPDTILFFTKTELHIVTSGKKAALLEPLAEAAREAAGVELRLHTRGKSEDGGAQAKALLDAATAADAVVLGTLTKEKPAGKQAESWATELKSRELQTVDIGLAIGEVYAVKDTAEVTCIKKAAFLAANAFTKFTVPQIETIIDEETKVKHSKLSERTEEVIADPAGKLSVKLRQDNCDIAYPPIIQSGGDYDLKISAQSNDKALSFDVILVSLGTRYQMYCANASRTYLVDPSKKQEAEYKALVKAQEAAIAALTEGAPMGGAQTAAIDALKEAGQPEMAEKLSGNVGWGIGLEFRESNHLLRTRTTAACRPGMAFNVVVGVAGLTRPDAAKDSGKTYALQVADTVVVQPGGTAPEVVTALVPKGWTDAAYFFNEQEEEEVKPAPAAETAQYDRGKSMRSEDPNFQQKQEESKRKYKQQSDLLNRVNQETLRQGQAQDGADTKSAGRRISEIVAYKSVSEVPATKELKIEVDTQREVVLVPIYGVMVPFHILTIKNATNNQDGDHSYIRLNFNFGPGYEPCVKFPGAICLKELSFRTADTQHAAKVVQGIKVLGANVRHREKERAERATLVTQERLVKGKGRVYVLPDVWIRPPFGGRGRKMTGQLEAHANGFRYTSPKGETLDIMYRNIAHAFFQPADNEMITLVHFNLRDSIMVGKKKTQDVQFYTEVMDSVQTLDTGRRSAYDPDELDEEQREREQRNKINKMYQSFVKRVTQEIWERDFGDLDMDFEIPFRELGFSGVPHRSTAFIMPTVTCLVELIEMPFTVVACAEILLVNLERVGFNLRNFDMTVIFKDLTKDVLRIDAIPSTSLDGVKEWLGSMDIKFYESKMNLNWKPILKNILEDPEGFIGDGGWDFLDAEGGSASEGEEGSEDGDDVFRPSEGEEEEVEESSEDDGKGRPLRSAAQESGESVVESEAGSDDEEELDSDEEEGLDWDELEARAARDDRKRGDDSDDDGRKRKGDGGGGGAKKRSRY